MNALKRHLRTKQLESAHRALPLEQTVDCACDPCLSRAVLHHNYWAETKVAACLRCGQVTAYRTVSVEMRAAGGDQGANFPVALPDELRAWLADWPRLLTLGPNSDDPIWAAADTRIESRAELESLTAARTAETGGWPPGRRLRALPTPGAPPPALHEVPWERELRLFERTHAALQLPDDSPLELWVSLAEPGRPGREVAVERLLRHPDIDALLCGWLQEAPTDPRWKTALSLLWWHRPLSPGSIAALVEALMRLPLMPSDSDASQIQEHRLLLDVFELLNAIEAPSAWIDDALAALEGRIGRRDWEVRQAIARLRKERSR